MSESYSHHPLSTERTIRLLKLKWYHNLSKITVPLECKIKNVSLDKLPHFLALSYAWESQLPTSHIICDEKKLPITANCEAALRQIGRLLKYGSSYLWVDSICIDQANTAERNHQVTLMADVYSQAKEVLIWLGESDKYSIRAISFLHYQMWINKIPLASVSQKVGKWFSNPRKCEQMICFIYERLEAEDFTARELFDSIFSRAWFSRIWTFQEVVFAKRATIILGHICLPYKCLEMADTLLSTQYLDHFLMHRNRPGPLQRLKAVKAFRTFLTMKRHDVYRVLSDSPHLNYSPSVDSIMKKPFSGSHAPLSLTKTLIRTFGLCTSDPRDYVYGHFALLRHFGVQISAPDYNRLPADVLADAGRALIEHDSDLDLLYFIASPRSLEGLPSWMPDLTCAPIYWIPSPGHGCATKRSNSQFRFHDRNLTLYGKSIGTIRKCSQNLPPLKWHSLESLLPEIAVCVQNWLYVIHLTQFGGQHDTDCSRCVELLCSLTFSDMETPGNSSSSWDGLGKAIQLASQLFQILSRIDLKDLVESNNLGSTCQIDAPGTSEDKISAFKAFRFI